MRGLLNHERRLRGLSGPSHPRAGGYPVVFLENLHVGIDRNTAAFQGDKETPGFLIYFRVLLFPYLPLTSTL